MVIGIITHCKREVYRKIILARFQSYDEEVIAAEHMVALLR